MECGAYLARYQEVPLWKKSYMKYHVFYFIYLFPLQVAIDAMEDVLGIKTLPLMVTFDYFIVRIPNL
jgi:hypothetical protein